ncbi:vWA domain-containing protein [Vibrio hepatarius]|uniref:vWA domain-containing protein n=1 Tax=Vibrio hepatarius TaxID=171383 RepID=UPI00142E362A|nr:vWA domain-containing protein [Vibrio hepatarius]NIY84160.1 pilus assembly protein TadG [Vibrio hepatarius]
MKHSRNKQQGIAGIVYVSMVPIMVMALAFAMQLSQQFLAHAKLAEASEVASLAVIASPKGDEDGNQDYVKSIIDRYVLDNKDDVIVSVNRQECHYSDGCVERSEEAGPFVDFFVQVKASYQSWIAYDSISLEPEFSLSGESSSRKYLPLPVDVYFILDVSGSMGEQSGTEGLQRIEVVKKVISRVVKDIEDFKTDVKSRVALAAYSGYTIKKTGQGLVPYDYASYNMPEETVNNMFNPPLRVDDSTGGLLRYHDIPLTDNYQHFLNTLKGDSFHLGSTGTQSWQGIISAAQEADKATEINPQQVFIILSDGMDTPKYSEYGLVEGYLKNLVDLGLCNKLKQRISSKPNRFESESPTDKEKTKVTMGVIGVNYKVDPNDGFGDCVGQKNIYHAQDGEDVYKYILNLINEETGRLRDS